MGLGIILAAILFAVIHLIAGLNPKQKQEINLLDLYKQERDRLIYAALHIKSESKDAFFEELDLFLETYKDEFPFCESDYNFTKGLANKTIKNNVNAGFFSDFQLN